MAYEFWIYPMAILIALISVGGEKTKNVELLGWLRTVTVCHGSVTPHIKGNRKAPQPLGDHYNNGWMRGRKRKDLSVI